VQAIIHSVISQHADEVSFLWTLRSQAVAAPHHSLADVGKLDGRVEAHLDGLRIAGEEGWQLCRRELAWEEPGEVFAAAVLAFEGGDEQRIGEVVKVGAAKAELAAGLVSALGWLSPERSEGYARALVTSESAVLRRAGLASFAVHRRDPGDALRSALRDQDPALQARALKTIGELGRADLSQDASLALASENPEVRFWAAWSVALLAGSASALSLLRHLAESSPSGTAEAVQMVARRSPLSEANAWQKNLAQRPEHLRLAINAAGHIGDPEAVPWLIHHMKSLPSARLAGEAFTLIIGVDLAYRDLERKPPEDFNAGPTEDPKDESVAMDPDDNLPWPESALVQKWWDKNRSQFQNGTRYLLGKPITQDWLKTVLRDGRQRQRAAAALEMALRNPGQPLFNVEAPGFRQIESLGKPGPSIR
jgi:uncharacterized protein (TIGR02270 family)